ncbi:hypothetical protein Stube_26170 [Streptomyces tubercidicus]|uniref:Uncharacterized protein n=1 Tax=Streptomyces tubercidicus TaxID=47759 RepID=A0A640URC4_9ACTN|nr:hypothetical protein Stube_26170 [Streptomyces tubercidicus]
MGSDLRKQPRWGAGGSSRDRAGRGGPRQPPGPGPAARPYRTTAISRDVWFSRRPPVSVHVTMSSIRTPKRPGR